MLVEYLYVSEPEQPLPIGTMNTLVDSCQRYNKAHDITGMLIYDGKRFMQVLEGEQAPLFELIEQIKHDDRHHDFIELFCCPIKQRNFPQWAMGFADLQQSPQLLSHDLPSLIGDLPLTYQVLLQFYKRTIETQ